MLPNPTHQEGTLLRWLPLLSTPCAFLLHESFRVRVLLRCNIVCSVRRNHGRRVPNPINIELYFFFDELFG